MSFKPSLHGWPFGNVLAVDPPTLGLGAPPHRRLGLGAGMCWAALDRYLAGTVIPRNAAPPEPGEPLHHELVRRNAAAVAGMWPMVQEWQALADRELGFRSRATWRWLRSHLVEGQPVLLTILPQSDVYSRAYAAWHVMATGWSITEDRVILSIYDPARPGEDDLRLEFTLAGPLHSRITGVRDIRGFFPVPYDRGRPDVEAAAVLSRGDDPLHEVLGAIAGAPGGSRLELVARTTRGALLHYRRRGGSPWQETVLMDPDVSGLDAIQGDPALLLAGGRAHAFARTYVGDLLHFQRGLRWVTMNRTDDERTGPRFRLAGRPVPVPAPGGGLSVFARAPGGGVVHYAGTRLGRWSAERLDGDAIVGDPVVARWNGTMEVFGLTDDGRVIHWKRDERGWSAAELASASARGPQLRLAARPVLHILDESIYLFARDQAGRLVHFRRTENGPWNTVTHPVEITGDPVATAGPGGIHVFATAPDGGIAHRWGETIWNGEDIARSRPRLGLPARTANMLLAAATEDGIRLFVRWPEDLVVLSWSEDADWTAVPLGQRPGHDADTLPATDLVLVQDGRERPHLFGRTPAGALAHVETVPWTEPVPEPVPDSSQREPVPESVPELLDLPSRELPIAVHAGPAGGAGSG